MCNAFHTTQSAGTANFNPTGTGTLDPNQDSFASGEVNPNINPVAEALAKNGIDPTSVGLRKPTGMGRLAEMATGGMYDPTGGADSGRFAYKGSTPTKWGMLARVLGPALEGGIIGMAGGKGHPGGGFGAANDFYMQQRQRQMAYIQMARILQNDQFKNALEYARTQHEMSLPPLTRVPNAIKGHDAQGNEIFMTLNPRTMRYEPVEGISPDSNADYATSNTDQGIVLYDKHGQSPTKQLTLPDAQPGPDGNAPTQMPTRPPMLPSTGTASQSPQGVNAAVAGSKMPLRPAYKQTVEDKAAQALKDKHPDWTDDQVFTQLNADKRKPENSKGDDTARAEQYAAAALAKSGGDPDKAIQFMNGLQLNDPAAKKDLGRLLPMIRRSITDRARSRKPKSRSALDMLMPPATQAPTEIQPQQ